MEEQKLCKDCKHYKSSSLYFSLQCVIKTNEINRVTGDPIYKVMDARMFRDNKNGCGPEGKYFERKVGIFGKAINFARRKLKELSEHASD